jgi:ElaB/YqjD/DUF883 family membrane-anchored ribosome-binding protein
MSTESNDKSGTKAGFRQNVHGLREDVGVLAGDLRTVASDTVETARAGAAELSEAAKRAVENAKLRLQDSSKVVIDAAGSARDVVAKNPLASLAIAAGAGLIIGLLLRSRR